MIYFKPHERQQEFIDAVFSGDYDFATFGGAFGGGKSYVGLAILILLSKIYKGSKWCVIRESLPTLKRTSIQTFKKVCPPKFIKGYNQQDQVVTFTNGSEIMFMAEDFANDKDFDRFKGLEVNGFLLEQIEELQEGLLDICFMRAGRHRVDPMPKSIIIANVNPTLAWPKEKIYDKWVNNSLPKRWLYMPATIQDNPTLANDKDYIAKFDNLDDLTRRRYIDGDWTAFAVKSPFLYAFELKKHTIKDYKPNIHLPLLISFDFNKEPMTALISQSENIRSLTIFDEIQLSNGSTPEVCEKIRAKYPDWLGRIIVTGDASGSSRSPLVRGSVNHYKLIKQGLTIKDSQFRVRAANISHSNSRMLCNSLLQNAEIRITENCKGTIKDCIYVQVDEDGDIVKTASQGAHLLDNFRYLCDAQFPDFIDRPHKYRQ